MSVKIIIPGALTTVQDMGRMGNMSSGFTESGAADRDSLILANILVGNPHNAAAFEMTLTGIGVQFTKDCTIALTGADMPLYINGKVKPTYAAHSIKKGDYLYCKRANSGCRSYLAVSGGIDVPKILGSRSTSLKISLGGFCGRRLQTGDVVPIGECDPVSNTEHRRLEPIKFPRNVILRAIRGPQDDLFSEEEMQKIFSSEFTVSPASDRMGIRLNGAPIIAEKGVDIISDGIVNGSVQVPKDGNPIVLIADHQTTGGYAKPITVISADIPAAAQLVPGCKVRFSEVTIEQAQTLYIKRKKEFEKFDKEWNR